MRIARFDDVDVLVVEGTLAGVALSLGLARAGLRTALAMSGTTPGYEHLTCMRGWIEDESIDSLPAELADLARSCVKETLSDGTRLLRLTAWGEGLEDALLDAGVRLYYDAHPAAALFDGDRAAGALFGGKFGLAAVTAKYVADCTPEGRLVRMAGVPFLPAASAPEGAKFSVVVQTDSVHSEPGKRYPFVPGADLRFLGALAELRFGLPAGSDAEPNSHARALLLAGLPAWAAANPSVPLAVHMIADGAVLVPGDRIEGAFAPGGIPGLAALGPVSGTPAERAAYLDSPTVFAVKAAAAAGEIASRLKAQAGVPPGTLSARFAAGREGAEFVPAESLSFSDPCFVEPSVDHIEVSIPPVPVEGSSDVLVAGGGTSGIISAWYAALKGLDTVCVEKHADVGGINTVGGVPCYWYGRRIPFFKNFYRLINREAKDNSFPVPLALLSMAKKAGTRFALKTPSAGAYRSGTEVRGVVCIGAGGLRVRTARTVIDATGDGDIAAWAGAPYQYGSGRDEITMWCSFGTFHHAQKEASRQYLTVVDQRSPHDTSRALTAARRMTGVTGKGEYPQHYLANRESRHIDGLKTVTYLDIMMGRTFPDIAFFCKSNVDIKGMHSSAAAMCGYIEKDFWQNFLSGIPYGALIPTALSNLVVVGKAYSITHDGLAMARMQPDMITLGAVGALIAKHYLSSAGAGAAPRDLRAGMPAGLSEELFRDGILVPGDLPGAEDERVPPADAAEVEDLVDRLLICPLAPDEWARLMLSGETAVPMIRARFHTALEYLKPQIAHFLTFLGDRSQTGYLLRRLEDLLSGPRLPGLHFPNRHDHPDHGWAPEPVWIVNTLALAGEMGVAASLERIASLLELDPAVSDYRFNYVHSVAFAGETLASPRLVPALRKLADDPALRGQSLQRGTDPRRCRDYIQERFAYLELCLARALARCGSAEGYRTLIEYLGDVRMFLARSALKELAELTSEDYGFDREAWTAWLDAHSGNLAPKPLTERLL